MKERIRVVLVDDHPLFRAGVALSLEETGRFEIVAEASDTDEALEIVQRFCPDLALVDLFMPTSGLEAVRLIGETAPDVNVVVLTASESDADIVAAICAGAKAYVLKGIGSAKLAGVLDAVMRGENYVPPAHAVQILTAIGRPTPVATPANDLLQRLTSRENEILRLVAGGLSNREVGSELNLRARTVKHHMTRILGKLNVRNRTQAAILRKSALNGT